MKKNQGQLSIFLGVSLLMIITLIAFVINVGLFVKAKINLQNAVDAAAWAGAAVQARQLSNMAYLNWEMRNNYKEWMFKYYVLGQLSVNKIANSGTNPGMDFTRDPFSPVGFSTPPGPGAPPSYDALNLPSVCIEHTGDSSNICNIFSAPGIPHFQASGLENMDRMTREFRTNVTSHLSHHCSVQTDLNFGVTATWAYGTGDDGTGNYLLPDVPTPVAFDNPGAWVNSMELGLRMRNLERILNRIPVENPLCPPNTSESGCTRISDLEPENVQSGHIINERPIKAFFSAYRNLSGGRAKESGRDTFANSFKLTELPPLPFDSSSQGSSSYLIPPSDSMPGQNPQEKHYVDMQMYLLNLATLFTHLSPGTRDYLGSPTGGSCTSLRMALPVPGFIFGFSKNPEVLTYYAVKGEAKFTGLFYPFSNFEGITLTAYAAAKPFGGRIGPKLFDINNSNAVTPRSGRERSAPYVMGIDSAGLSSSPFILFPYNKTGGIEFWIDDGSIPFPIGGTSTSNDPRFAIPNLLYDYIGDMDNHLPAVGSDLFNLIEKDQTGQRIGLYDGEQFRAMLDRAGLPGFSGGGASGTLSASDIYEAIDNIRSPTCYEALNYLIPTPMVGGSHDQETTSNPSVVSAITGESSSESKITYKLFAPLIGDHALYADISSIKTVVDDYLIDNQAGIQVYLDTLVDVARDLRDPTVTPPPPPVPGTPSGGSSPYAQAADKLHAPSGDPNCKSLHSKYSYLFNGARGSVSCPASVGITPLGIKIDEYLNFRLSTRDAFANYFVSRYTRIPDNSLCPGNLSLMTAYSPGPQQGVGSDAVWTPPLTSSSPLNTNRNFYSTKFISLEKVKDDGFYGYTNIMTYQEDGDFNTTPPAGLTISSGMNKNSIQSGDLAGLGDPLNH